MNKVLTNLKQDFTEAEVAQLAANLQQVLEGMGKSDFYYWRPQVNKDTGVIEWTLVKSLIPPEKVSVKGNPGDNGKTYAPQMTGTWLKWVEDGTPSTESVDLKLHFSDLTEAEKTELKGVKGDEPEITIGQQTGNWVIDGVDSGVKAQGQQGDQPTISEYKDDDGHTIGITITSNGTTLNILNGTDGKDGQGIAIAGSVDTYADLAGKKTTAKAGDGYLVKRGSEGIDDGLLYIFDGSDFPPEAEGVKFQGPKGEQGDAGTTWIPQITNNILSWTNDTSKAPPTNINVKGDPGEPGDDGKTYVPTWNNTTLSFTAQGLDPIEGVDLKGDAGYSPQVVVGSVDATEEHKNGGTSASITYWSEQASTTAKAGFTAWNGNDGKDWDGTTGRLIQGDFIKLTPTGDDLEISVTGDFVTSSTIVGTDQYALTTAGWAKVQGGGGGSFTGIDANAAYFSGNGDTTALDLNGDFVSGLFTSASLGAYITSHSGDAAVLCKGYNIYAVGAASDTRGDEPYADAGALTAIMLPGALTYYTGRIGNEGSSNTSAYVGSTIDGGGWKRLFLSAGSATKLAKATPDDAGNTFNFIKQQIHSSETTVSNEWENDNTLHFILE